MIKPSLVSEELVIEGTPALDEVYRGVCCEGHDWAVAYVVPDPNPGYVSAWGVCQNPDCPDYQEDLGPTDPYRGVNYILAEDIAVLMLEGKVTV